ncbi:hypothetical protein [Pseudobutyrivibrio xylanivorans]|nr:hypothetical protein [Pseudobutyrivibrio xylanivorans]
MPNDPDVRPEYEDIQVDIEKDYSTIFIGYLETDLVEVPQKMR